MTRAISLLDNDYSFFEERDIYTAQEAFRAAQSKAQQVAQGLKASLHEDVATYRAHLNTLIEPYPLLQEAVVQDIKMVTQHAQQFGQQFLTQMQKYTTQHTPQITESYADDPYEFFDEASAKQLRTFQTLKSNLQTLRIVGNFQLLGKSNIRIYDVFTALLGFIFVEALLNQVPTGLIFGIGVLSFLIAPIIEECVKAFSVTYIKSKISLYITYALEALYESVVLVTVSYGMARKGWNAGGVNSVLGPIGGAIFLAASLFGENYVFQRQQNTIKMYKSDIARLGKIRPQTLFKGMALHLLWDVVGFLSGLQRLMKLFLNGLLDLGLPVNKIPGLSTAFTRLFGPLR